MLEEAFASQTRPPPAGNRMTSIRSKPSYPNRGSRALVAYHIESTRDGKVIKWVHALSDIELLAFLGSVTYVNDHEDFSRLVHIV